MAKDTISPDHYKREKIDCIDAIHEALGNDQYEGYLRGNVMKYVWRYPDKGGVKDLEKAKVYLYWLIGLLEMREELLDDLIRDGKSDVSAPFKFLD